MVIGDEFKYVITEETAKVILVHMLPIYFGYQKAGILGTAKDLIEILARAFPGRTSERARRTTMCVNCT